ncbi:MAG: restriction endonuclease subunit S [Deltaproteobacteria bacterium]|nr:restriction endonuclease subunit S [Deltaproteobacteria bacterium]
MIDKNYSFQDIPATWVSCSLGDLAIYIQRGKSPKYVKKSALPVINQKSLRWDRLIREYFKYIAAEQQPFWEEDRYIKVNDIIWNSTGTGTVGRAYRVKETDIDCPKVVDSHVTIVRMHADICSRYAHFWISGPYVQQQIGEMCDGSTNQIELSRSTISETQIPLPPLPEQHRIVAKIEELFSELDKGVEALKTAQQQLKVYRQAVLKWAFEGKLTEEWRRRQKNLPTAERLLEQIKTQREKEIKATGKKRKPVAELTKKDLAKMPTLPEGWLWTKLDYIGELGRGKSKHRPRNDKRLFGGPYPFVQTGEIKAVKEVVKSYGNTYSEFGLSQSKLWPKGTLCITIAANIAEAAFLGFDSCFPDSVVGFSPNANLTMSKFIFLFFRGNQRTIEEFAPATAQKNINLNILENLNIPYCSHKEQNRVVQEIESRLSVADKIEEAITQSLKQAEALRQSILKKAFSGKLVPQDPNDEPAEKLLARIRAEKAAQSAVKGTTKRKGAGRRVASSRNVAGRP